MAEYIDREAAIDRVYDCCMESVSCNLNCIKDIPAADVVPVVRCKDCKHYDDGWCQRVHNPAQYSKTPDDWYCADGKRKDGDGE